MEPRSPLSRLRVALERLYDQYNRREFVHPDPLEFLYDYPDPYDREIVGLLAAGLAYGRVTQILRNMRALLARLGPSPRLFVERATPVSLREALGSFQHRWTTGRDIARLLLGVQQAIRQYGSLHGAFVAGLRDDHETVMPALVSFVRQLRLDPQRNSLLADPASGAACKRLHLFLRWMVRRDEVDPGGWDDVSPARLIVPLDTHMFRVAAALGLCRRRQPDLQAALQMTAAFRQLAPADPVRYDFALTRLGIRPELNLEQFLASSPRLASPARPLRRLETPPRRR